MYGGRFYSSEIEASSDLMFTVMIVSLWSLWRSLNVDARLRTSYKEFCMQLGLEIMGFALSID